MTQDTIEADGAEEIAELFVDVREGDWLTLTYETPDGDERTAHAEAVTDAKVTERAEGDPAAGNVAFWYRDFERAEGDADGVPFARCATGRWSLRAHRWSVSTATRRRRRRRP